MESFLKIVQTYADPLEITIENGEELCTSMSVGRAFGKNHDQVLSDIRRLAMTESFREMNFRKRWKTWKNPCTRRDMKSPYYLCTLKGVMLLLLNWRSELFQRIKIDIVDDYFKKQSEINRLNKLLVGEPYKLVDQWQREYAEKLFNSEH